MNNKTTRVRLLSIFLGGCALALAGIVSADPSGRVARLSYVSGPVSFSPAGEDQWVEAGVNRPLTTGDRLWTDQGARAELQIGSAVIRASAETSVTVLNLDDSVAQFQLAQGTVTVRVRRLAPDSTFEIDTPNLAFSIKQPGEYRIDVDLNGDATAVAVRSGSAEVYGEGAAYVIGQSQWYRFTGVGLAQYDSAGLPPPDDYDRWCFERDRRAASAVAAQYVSPEVIGYEDLDEYGSWRSVAGYGNVWTPARVSIGWSPYHYGHWAWIDPWGWTWVDDAPWGFAPFHYGRWAYIGSGWGWIPGPIAVRPVYAPALVAFIGGISAGIAWFPLGPHEVYRPAYSVSRNYFTNINVSNTTVNNTYITNIYNNSNVTQTYVNQRVNGAVVAVPPAAFADSRQVAQAAVPVSGEMLARGRISPMAAVVPATAAVLGAGAAARFRPSPAVLARPAVARIAPPPTSVPFAARQEALRAHPGQPLDAAALATIRPAAQTASQPKIRVVQSAQPAKPIAAGGGANRPGNAGFGRPPAAGGTSEPAAQKGGPPQGPAIEPNRESLRPQGQAQMQGQGQGKGQGQGPGAGQGAGQGQGQGQGPGRPAENRQDQRPQGQGQAQGQGPARPPEIRQDARPQGQGQAQGQGQQQEQQQLRQQQQQQKQQQQQQQQQKQQQEQQKQQQEQQTQRQEQQKQQQQQQQQQLQQKQQQGQQRQQQEQQKQQQELQKQQQQQRPQAQPAEAKPAQPAKGEAKGDPKGDAKRDERKKGPE